MRTAHSVCAAWRKKLVEKTLPEALDEACHVLAGEVEARAPKVTGDLAGSVEARKATQTERQKITAHVLVKKFYAHMVEYGTIWMTAHPFFRPAVESTLSKMITIVKKTTRRR